VLKKLSTVNKLSTLVDNSVLFWVHLVQIFAAEQQSVMMMTMI